MNVDEAQIDDCVELKNIKYQTMLLNNKTNLTPNINIDIQNIDKFLDEERLSNSEKPWSKLSSSIKLRLIEKYIKIYSDNNNLSSEQSTKLFVYLRKQLERRKLQRVKDVVYDISKNEIIDIPGLIYNKLNSKFTIKKLDKNGSSSLKNLAPKTLKNKKKKKSRDKKRKKTRDEKSKKKKEEKKKNKIDIKTSE
tara:strand:- start:63 stop:644 length:582 start_codon:yes stop_codon:yes gene_type:complete